MYSTVEVENVRNLIWDYYHDHGRSMPWRVPLTDGTFDPYQIMVSEIMLQQTQVSRVVPKFEDFIARFPTVQHLASAQLAEVLGLWSGLGYNRRAKYLHTAAQQVVGMYGGRFPEQQKALIALSGIGNNTAGAIVAYTFNLPALFVETNIRTVIIHHFFSDDEKVSDKDVLAVLELLLDREHPREFYWALMDYGSYIKATVGNVSRRSKQYVRQSAFEGSRRQLRGLVLRLLHDKPWTEQALAVETADPRLKEVLEALAREQMIVYHNGQYRIA